MKSGFPVCRCLFHSFYELKDKSYSPDKLTYSLKQRNTRKQPIKIEQCGFARRCNIESEPFASIN